MKIITFLIPLGIPLAIAACATASLSTRGQKVLPLASQPGPDCKNLGTVIGQGGGAFGGAYISNDKLMEYAMNDAMNKAAERGATHFQAAGAPSLGGYGGTTTTATVIGIAYRCPQESGAVAETPAEAPAGTSTSYLTNCPQHDGESVRERAIRCKAAAANQRK
jgi:hypothetical protein